MSIPEPAAVTVKVALEPRGTLRLAGWVVMVGPLATVKLIAALSAEPSVLLRWQE